MGKPNMGKPARAKKLDIQRPLYESPKVPDKSNGGPARRSQANKLELAALREEVRQAAATEGGRKSVATKALLGQIEARFGNDEWKKIAQEFHITYKGVAQSPVNVQIGVGPVQ